MKFVLNLFRFSTYHYLYNIYTKIINWKLSIYIFRVSLWAYSLDQVANYINSTCHCLGLLVHHSNWQLGLPVSISTVCFSWTFSSLSIYSPLFKIVSISIWFHQVRMCITLIFYNSIADLISILTPLKVKLD